MDSRLFGGADACVARWTRFLGVALGAAGLVVSCATTPETPPPAQAPPPPEASALEKPEPKLDDQPLLPHVPASAFAALILRRTATQGLPESLAEPPELRPRLRAHLERTAGVDLTAINGAVLFITGLEPSEGALFLRLERPGQLRGEAVATHEGTPIHEKEEVFFAAVPAGIVVGTENAVRMAIDVARGKSPAVNVRSPLGFLTELGLAHEIVLGVSVPPSAHPILAVPAAQLGVEGAVLTYEQAAGTHTVSLRILGEPERLRQVQSVVEVAKAGVLAKLEAEVQEAADKAAEGAMAILTSEKTRHALAQIEPIMDGASLVATYEHRETSSSPPGVVAMTVIGIGAAIAIPAMVRYIRKAKAEEATAGVNDLHELAVELAKKKRRLPNSVPWTPAEPCCSQPGGKCAVDENTFSHKTWRALGFAPEGPLYYQYRFTRTGRGRKASFTVEARGDLDCDGKFSSFRREGRLDKKGNTIGSELQVHDEIE